LRAGEVGRGCPKTKAEKIGPRSGRSSREFLGGKSRKPTFDEPRSVVAGVPACRTPESAGRDARRHEADLRLARGPAADNPRSAIPGPRSVRLHSARLRP